MSIDNGRQPAEGTRGGWSVQQVCELGLTTDVETAGAVLGIGRTKAYEQAQAGEFPVKILRVGAATWCQPRRCWSCSALLGAAGGPGAS